MYIRHVDPSIDHQDLTLKETPKKAKKYKIEEGVSRQVERQSNSVGLWLPLSSPTNPTPPLLNCPNPFPATCSERRLSPLFERTYYSTGRQQHQDNCCCKCDRCTSCEENNRDQHENLRGIVQVVVLNKTKKTKKQKDKQKQKHNDKNASIRWWFSTRWSQWQRQTKTQCQKGIKQVVLNKMKEPCRRVGESWTLREGFTAGQWTCSLLMLAHNY